MGGELNGCLRHWLTKLNRSLMRQTTGSSPSMVESGGEKLAQS